MQLIFKKYCGLKALTKGTIRYNSLNIIMNYNNIVMIKQ